MTTDGIIDTMATSVSDDVATAMTLTPSNTELPYLAFDVNYIAVPTIAIMIAIAGNTIMLYTLIKEKQLMQSVPFIPWIYNIVIADIVLSYVVMPWAMIVEFELPGVKRVCMWKCRSALVTLAMIPLSVMSWSLLLNSIHRLFCIKAAIIGNNEVIMNGRLQRYGHVVCIVIWVGSCLVGVTINACSSLPVSRAPAIAGSWACKDTSIPAMCACFLIPISFSVQMTALAKYRIWRNRDILCGHVEETGNPRYNVYVGVRPGEEPQPEQTCVSEQERVRNALNFNLTIFCSTICLLIAWLPFAVIFLLVALEPKPRVGGLKDTHLNMALLWVGFLSSAVFPILYGVTWVKFRQTLLKRWFPFRCQANENDEEIRSICSSEPRKCVSVVA